MSDTMMPTLGVVPRPVDRHAAHARNRARYYGDGRNWATPPDLFERLDAEFGFTLDPCASEWNAKCARYFTEAENGLEQSWAGERVFMNPPYGRELYAWTKKAHEEAMRDVLVVGLVPAATDLAWWHDHVVCARAEVRYIRGRVRFQTSDGRWANAFTPSVIVVWRGAA
ncbi:MAG: phage N-6-adenine-methyltransferase [Gemmatimonadaceae bacterium]|nr:phage N-6-adenine-methyltransferase [Gemmatimonadaceae bacterium]